MALHWATESLQCYMVGFLQSIGLDQGENAEVGLFGMRHLADSMVEALLYLYSAIFRIPLISSRECELRAISPRIRRSTFERVFFAN
jgi:hypothetical protein